MERDDDEFITVPEAARRLGISEQTAWNWSARGALPVTRVGVRATLVRARDVERLEGFRPQRGRPRGDVMGWNVPVGKVKTLTVEQLPEHQSIDQMIESALTKIQGDNTGKLVNIIDIQVFRGDRAYMGVVYYHL